MKRLSFSLFFFGLAGCSVGNNEPAAKGSAEERSIARIQEVAQLGRELEKMAFDLESFVDEARRRVEAGEPREIQVKEIQQQLGMIRLKQEKLNEKLYALEQGLKPSESSRTDALKTTP